jgi:hypothetical protein
MSDLTDRLDEAVARQLPNNVEWKEVGAARRAMLAELDKMGWAVVPKEPTDDMMAAWYDAAEKWVHEEGEDSAPYKVMLAAAPKLEDV